MSIDTEICNFYRDVIAPLETTVNSQRSVKKISPISRLDFNTGAGLAILFLVQKIAQSIFFLAGSVATLGLHEGMRISLLKNAKEGLVYAGAIPLGIVGIFFPQTIN
ncbi:hypothetical protein [Candidatus Protochlamydia amoebophila]|uniref:Uncharacterized protein n=1 Tax=Candidatus Protochlamydia amoebophila TaxID=362787 RepID=A0A0C1H7T1_9BACT|nr:hypothetical protein [Candidatus Protochlamydia amoebophila]KIC70948.1 Uncharacterized protein DB44_FF00290 [Candidatus Protochlamydia amoebophila]